MSDILEYYVAISRDSEPIKWVTKGRSLTDDFADAQPYSTEERAREVEREEELDGDITYIFALLGS